jgi:hypothetical protein
MNRPVVVLLAETAALTIEQQAFRATAPATLSFALPLSVWLDHRWSVRPLEKPKPVATRGSERWWSFMQVVARAVNPRSKRRVTVVSGGSMSVVGKKTLIGDMERTIVQGTRRVLPPSVCREPSSERYSFHAKTLQVRLTPASPL